MFPEFFERILEKVFLLLKIIVVVLVLRVAVKIFGLNIHIPYVDEGISMLLTLVTRFVGRLLGVTVQTWHL